MRSRALIVCISFVVFVGCNSSPESVKLERYRVAGERLYANVCSNCHQDAGQGLLKLYPPINKPITTERLSHIVCRVKYGSTDTLEIEGITYTLPMPDLGLSDLEVAEISTYLSNSWGNQNGIVDVNTVSNLIKDCK